MKIVYKIDDVRAEVKAAKRQDKIIRFVPTMGFLHQGHISLVKIGRENSEYVVMSIFVNKLQFNDLNDFNGYPKNLERDMEMAEKGGVDLLFIPDDKEMYQNNLTTVDVGLLTDNLCGASRPGHFKGVFTVVSKLFNIVQPDVAAFGQKDIQQVVSIEKMVFDLNFPIKIIVAPIIRESDGLAMSSRNKHLNEKQRKDALALNRSLQACRKLIDSGERDVKIITDSIRSVIQEGSPDSIDYVSMVRYEDLSYIKKIEGKAVVAVAAFWGTTRLIDNMIIDKTDNGYVCIS
ncbi:MAG TPA: pantoate--beta-alanine ligase [Spirochaetota bacterium]|nr:pantoate--beta-alanine ligase [Spirochaetota bacterium]HPS85896.1 pantoate--beta-alanine ligase [Spirochaetota bacterium]